MKLKALLITEQYIDIREDGCYCNYALYGTLQNMSVLGDLSIAANSQALGKPASQPLDQKIEFVSPQNVVFLRPTNRRICDYWKNSRYNYKLLKDLIPSVDLVILYLPLANSVDILKMAKHYSIPVLSFLVGCPWDMLRNHHRLLARIIAPIRFFSTRYTVKYSDFVHYVTEHFLQQRYSTNGKALGCSDVNLSTIDSAILAFRNRKIESRKDNDTIRLVTTAHLDVRYKGQEYVIRAIAQLKSLGKNNYCYELIGNGKGGYLRDLCRQLNVEDQVIFLGRKAPNEVMEILRNADIYIQPSLTEGLPRSVVEAMSVALPCIGFNSGGIPELLDSEFVIDKRDINGIIRCILGLQNIGKYKEVSERNFRFSFSYEHSKLTKRIQSFFLEIRKSVELKYKYYK